MHPYNININTSGLLQLQYFNDCQQNLLINNNEKIKHNNDRTGET